MTMTDGGERDDTSQIDVSAVLEGLRAEVRARRLTESRAEPSPLEVDLQRSLDDIELYRVVSAHWPLIGKTIPERIVALINKLVRRYLRWYINPIVEQQNAYNDVVARTLRQLAEAYADLGQQIGEGREPRTENREPAPAGSTGYPLGEQRTKNKEQGLEGHALRTMHYALRTTDYPELIALVHARAAAESPARFPDLELRALEPHLRLRQMVNAHWPLIGRTVSQRAIALINKLVRRYLRWYINPIVEQQNAANAAIAAALLALVRLDAERRAQVASIRARGRTRITE
jgi:hypothetical protein